MVCRHECLHEQHDIFHLLAKSDTGNGIPCTPPPFVVRRAGLLGTLGLIVIGHIRHSAPSQAPPSYLFFMGVGGGGGWDGDGGGGEVVTIMGTHTCIVMMRHPFRY